MFDIMKVYSALAAAQLERVGNIFYLRNFSNDFLILSESFL